MIKCPKCELNYMSDDAECCEVCRKMLHGTDEEEFEICPECGKAFNTGKEMCNRCLQKLDEQREEEYDPSSDDEIVEEEDLEKLGLSITDDEE